MATVETGKDKVKKICEVLRKETLEPAMEEADKIVAEAKARADEIVKEARAKSAKMLADTDADIDKRRAIFKASLNQGARQAVEWLKQEIEERLLNQQLANLIGKSTSSPQVLSEMVTAIIKAIEEEGLDTDLSAIIPSSVQPEEVNELLGKEILERLKEKSVIVGPKKGGIEVKLYKENITIDLSDSALLELVTRYIRKDFQQFFFAAK